MAPKQGAAPHATTSRNAPLSAKTTAAATVHSDHRSAVDRAIAKTGQRRINAVLSELQGQRVAQASQASSKAQPWRPLSIKHGDMGIAGGVEGELLNARARSCDPQQASHAVGWDFAAGTWSLADTTPTSVAQQELGVQHSGLGVKGRGAARAGARYARLGCKACDAEPATDAAFAAGAWVSSNGLARC